MDKALLVRTILVICSSGFLLISLFIKSKASTTTEVVLLFKCHIFVFSVSRILYLFSFTKTFADMFLSLGITWPNFFCFVSGNHFQAIFLYCLIYFYKKISEYGNICSLNYKFRIMFILVFSCFYPVAMTDIPIQILTYPIMTVSGLIGCKY